MSYRPSQDAALLRFKTNDTVWMALYLRSQHRVGMFDVPSLLFFNNTKIPATFKYSQLPTPPAFRLAAYIRNLHSPVSSFPYFDQPQIVCVAFP
jgi:hypothetical protein